MMPRRKKAGHRAGAFMAGIGAFTAVLAGMHPVSLIGGALVAGGMWLRSKLYLDDPDACAEYRELFRTMPLSEALSAFRSSVGESSSPTQNILRFASASDIKRSLDLEMQSQPQPMAISTLVRLYTVRNLSDMITAGVVTVAFVKEHFDSELGAMSFSTFWECLQQQYALRQSDLPTESPLMHSVANRIYSFVAPEDTLGALHAAIPEAVNLGLVKAKFLEEFCWTDRHGKVLPRAPVDPTAEGPVQPRETAGGSNGVWQNMVRFGPWVRDQLSIPRQQLCGIVESCPFALDSFVRVEVMVSAGLFELIQQSLLTPTFIEKRLRAELERENVTIKSLSEYQRGCDIRKLLSCKIVHPETVSVLFRSAIPTTEATWGSVGSFWSAASCPNQHNNIIAFAEEWETTLRAHPCLVPERLRTHMMAVYEGFCQRRNKIRADATSRRRTEDQETVETKLRREKELAHRDFCARIRAQDQPQRPCIQM